MTSKGSNIIIVVKEMMIMEQNFIEDFLDKFDDVIIPYMGSSSNIDYRDAFMSRNKYLQFYAYLRLIDSMLIDSEHILYLIRYFDYDDIMCLLEKWYQNIKFCDELYQQFISMLVYFDIDSIVSDFIFRDIIEETE